MEAHSRGIEAHSGAMEVHLETKRLTPRNFDAILEPYRLTLVLHGPPW
jgi:hypothetical protein